MDIENARHLSNSYALGAINSDRCIHMYIIPLSYTLSKMQPAPFHFHNSFSEFINV